MSSAISEKGRVHSRTFEDLLVILKSGDADQPYSRGGPQEDDKDPFLAITLLEGVKILPARPVRNPVVDDSRLCHVAQRRRAS